jgi:hypothetical protein
MTYRLTSTLTTEFLQKTALNARGTPTELGKVWDAKRRVRDAFAVRAWRKLPR